jgi:hypothetical protein
MEIKFRAIIPEHNAIIYFDLSDLVHPSRKDLFSKREILIPWLLAGNNPDRYSEIKDKKGKDIYERDTVKKDGDWRNYRIIIDYAGVRPFHEDALKSCPVKEPRPVINMLPLKGGIVAETFEIVDDIHSTENG